MSNVISLKNKTIEKMIDEVHREFATVTADTKRADRARVRAGKLLVELRKRVEAGEIGEGVNWWKWYDKHFAPTRRNARQVMKLASAKDPEAAHDEERAARNERRGKARLHQPTVEHVLSQIEEMNEEDRQQLFAELRRLYAY